MEQKITIDDNERSGWATNFLPFSFRRAGWLIVAVTCVLGILSLTKSITGNFNVTQKAMIQTILQNALIVGLFLVAWSQEKVEDMAITNKRIRTLCYALVISIFFTLANSIIGLIKQNKLLDISSGRFIIILLISIILVNLSNKRDRKPAR